VPEKFRYSLRKNKKAKVLGTGTPGGSANKNETGRLHLPSLAGVI